MTFVAAPTHLDNWPRVWTVGTHGTIVFFRVLASKLTSKELLLKHQQVGELASTCWCYFVERTKKVFSEMHFAKFGFRAKLAHNDHDCPTCKTTTQSQATHAWLLYAASPN